MGASYERTSTPGIYRRGKSYVVKERDALGTMLTRSCATLTEARKVKAAIRADAARGEHRPHTRMAFDAYAREWIATYQGRTSRGLKESTLIGYESDLENHAIPFFKRTALTEIEPRDVKRLAAACSKQGGLSKRSVRRVMAPVKALFATAFEDGLIRVNPAANVRLSMPADAVEREERVRALSSAQLAAVLDLIPEHHYVIVLLMARTGLRVGEAVALRWQDIDLDAGVLHVRRSYPKRVLSTPKSRYGTRSVPLTPDLKSELVEHRRATPEAGADALVFPGERGFLDASNLQRKCFRPAAHEAGVPWATLHTLRHTFATTCFRHGCNVKHVQRLLGHHSAAFTLETYVHMLPEDMPDLSFLDNAT